MDTKKIQVHHVHVHIHGYSYLLSKHIDYHWSTSYARFHWTSTKRITLKLIKCQTNYLEFQIQNWYEGVSINASGTVIKIGVVTVPFDTLCKISVSQPDACRICMLDCQSVHKAVSGKCGRHPNRPDELTCLCDYSQATTLPSVSSVCRSYSLNFLKTDFRMFCFNFLILQNTFWFYLFQWTNLLTHL